MRISEEECRSIGRALAEVVLFPALGVTVNQVHAAIGRKATALLAPLLLAEPCPAEIDLAGAQANATVWNLEVCRLLFDNRLASVTAKPDPAIEAVKALLRRRAIVPDGDTLGLVAELLVAVDEARASHRAAQGSLSKSESAGCES